MFLLSHPTWVRGLKSSDIGLVFRVPVSHPTWVRGLKLNGTPLSKNLMDVAPHVGAWIEMPKTSCLILPAMSHPTWVRGLKCKGCRCGAEPYESHPTWVRGLKSFICLFPFVPDGVAPHVGAWIEIPEIMRMTPTRFVAPHVGAWIEILSAPLSCS